MYPVLYARLVEEGGYERTHVRACPDDDDDDDFVLLLLLRGRADVVRVDDRQVCSSSPARIECSAQEQYIK